MSHRAAPGDTPFRAPKARSDHLRARFSFRQFLSRIIPKRGRHQ